MAALTKEQWLSANQKFLHGNAVLYIVDKVWEAATALAEEKFTSTNTSSQKSCRSCIKIYACIRAGDKIEQCEEFESTLV